MTTRYFNTAGPVDCGEHYCLPPLERLDLNDILGLIRQKKYFVLHAPRQAGKTTYLLALQDHLNQTGQYRCLYVNVEAAQANREDVHRGIRAVLNQMALAAKTSLNDSYVASILEETLQRAGATAALNEILTLWPQQNPLPFILLIDEIDTLVGDTLISILRQLRAGYIRRPRNFPQSVILCGVRDVRDYRLRSAEGKAIITGGSAFNIKAESLRLGNFTPDEVETLYRQHTGETGQIFAAGATDLVWDLTRGQPWLVNALGYEVCFRMKAGRERTRPVTIEMMIEAKERLIERRETHLDQLVDKLREERVRRVIEPILAGTATPQLIPDDDILYAQDLGLIETEGQLRLANPIYQEIIPRQLTFSTQRTISHEPAWYITPEGRLDMTTLLAAFQQFFREHSEHWVERFDYKEAGPQLLLQAFLQRIVNHGGRIEREYGLGRKRTDLLIVWPYPAGVQRIVLELKLLQTSLEKTVTEGLPQTWSYMDRCRSDEGHLIIFDRTEEKSWDEKIFKRVEEYQDRRIMVWGM